MTKTPEENLKTILSAVEGEAQAPETPSPPSDQKPSDQKPSDQKPSPESSPENSSPAPAIVEGPSPQPTTNPSVSETIPKSRIKEIKDTLLLMESDRISLAEVRALFEFLFKEEDRAK